MPNLTKYNQNGLELFINNDDGSVWASRSACARMIDKDSIYVRKHEKALIEGGNKINVLEAEILTDGGLQGGNFFDESFIYSLLLKYKPDLLIQCAKAGLRVYLYGMVGYQVGIIQPATDSDLHAKIENLERMVSQLLANQVNPTHHPTQPTKIKRITPAPQC